MSHLYNGIRCNTRIRYNVNPICTKIIGSCIFSLTVACYYLGKHKFGYLLESPRRGDSNKYTKRMKNTRYSCLRRVHIKFLYNCKFDFTAKFLVTNTVVITRVLYTNERARPRTTIIPETSVILPLRELILHHLVNRFPIWAQGHNQSCNLRNVLILRLKISM